MRGITKTYETGQRSYTALESVNLSIADGTFTAIIGRSGSGKSTLLNLIAGIDRPTSGEVMVNGTPVHTLTENQMAMWRGRTVGVVFQFFQLLPTLTVLENVLLPMDFTHVYPARERKARALKLLEQVGVRDQADKLPSLLSGGQQQRAAIARALANDPPLILADEPTGNLDSQTANAVFELFKTLAAEGKTIVMVTHERDTAQWVSHSVTLDDGRVVESGSLAERTPFDHRKEMAYG